MEKLKIDTKKEIIIDKMKPIILKLGLLAFLLMKKQKAIKDNIVNAHSISSISSHLMFNLKKLIFYSNTLNFHEIRML